MAWITEVQADEFLNPNTKWDEFTNKGELLKLATNRLEQLTFKGEAIDRVGFRYIDGNSVSKIAGSADFLLNPENGNFAYHEALGWTRGTSPGLDLAIYNLNGEPYVVFDCPHTSTGNYNYERVLTLNEIQSLHSFGGTFTGEIALDTQLGRLGMFSAFETNQATALVDKKGEQVFFGSNNRRVAGAFQHNNTHVQSSPHSYGYENITFDGIQTREVINEQGETVEITVPEILAGEIFSYRVKVVNGFDNTMFVYINDMLVGNPIFDISGQNQSRLQYSSGATAGGLRHSYIELFGAMVNTENPITIPLRLVGACALLALQYGKYPPDFVSDTEYLENENDYNRMQDLPINVQSAVEPFLTDYESVIVDGVATTTFRGAQEVDPTRKKMTVLEYD